jgi:uncharacterized membrane protein
LTIRNFSAKLTLVLPGALFHQASCMHPWKTYALILGGATLWCCALVMAPAFAAWEGAPSWIASTLYRFFDPVCHQIDDRSFHLFGSPLAVCSRCASIYFAFLAGTLAYPLIRGIRRTGMPSRALLLVALLPMLFDAAAGFFGLHQITLLTRTFTGALFGLLLPLFVIPAAIEGAAQLFSPQPQKGLPDA